jgi:hypothetical protein
MFGSNEYLSFVDKIPVFIHKVRFYNFYYNSMMLALYKAYKYFILKVFQSHLLSDVFFADNTDYKSNTF